MENNQKVEVLKRIYYKTSNPGSFGGVERLLREAKKIDSNIKRKDVKEWLKSQITYTLHKPKINRFKRNPILAEFPNENFQADTIFYKDEAKDNDGINQLLTVIDVFTKYAWCFPLRPKMVVVDVVSAMEKIIKQSKPMKLQTDKGTEFKNERFASLMEKYEINHFYAKNQPIKCAIVERFNQTLKDRIQPYITSTGEKRYIDELDNILKAYNNCYHSSIDMTPIEASSCDPKIVFKNLYDLESKREFLRKNSKPKIKVGSIVRTAYLKKIHDRKRFPNWTDQTFEVHKHLPGSKRPYYQLKDSEGNISQKRYYPNEVQEINPQSYRVEKILKQRKYKGVKQFFVKWLNYPETSNSWIPASNITTING